jgi:hypothetical protein
MPQPDAAPSTKYALFALDDDPLKRPFEFKAEMSRPLGSKPDENRLGIFFGRRDAIALGDMPPAFFILELVDPSDIPDRQAHVRIGSIVLKDRVGDRTEFESDRPLPKGQAILPLQHSGGWHSVKIRAHKKTILVSVDGDSVREINLAELKSLDPHPSTLTLDPGGALGVWSRNGVGFFREAYVASLPPEE